MTDTPNPAPSLEADLARWLHHAEWVALTDTPPPGSSWPGAKHRRMAKIMLDDPAGLPAHLSF